MCWPEANTEEKTRNKSWDRINGGDSARNREDERGTSLMLKSGENEWSNGTPRGGNLWEWRGGKHGRPANINALISRSSYSCYENSSFIM